VRGNDQRRRIKGNIANISSGLEIGHFWVALSLSTKARPGVQPFLLYSWRFSRYGAPIHWVLHCHLKSNNETQWNCFPPNAMSGQHCENHDVTQEAVHCYPRNVDRCCTSFVKNVIICFPPVWPICPFAGLRSFKVSFLGNDIGDLAFHEMVFVSSFR